MRLSTPLPLWTAAVLLAVTATAGAGDKAPQTLEQAQKLAAAQGTPILMKVEADWCGSCAAFQKAFDEDAEFRGAVSEGVVVFRIDGEKGEGIDLAKTYGVVGYPTFILADESGELMDSWMGYYSSEKFLKQKTEATTDPTTLAERMTRFRENPTEADARKLGDLRLTFGYPAEAVAYYRRADALNPSADTDYDLRILGAMARGAYAQLFTMPEVRSQADAIYASADASPKSMLSAYWTMSKIAQKAHTPEITYPYLRMTYEAISGSEDEKLRKSADKLRPDYALHIERDPKKAIQARKDIMPDGWMEDGRSLNQVAWWCFENRVNLVEAEEYARRGVELAEAGRDKANVLDTLAEICNLNDDCHQAVQYIHLAIEEDPDNEYFRNQLGRFEEILAQGGNR